MGELRDVWALAAGDMVDPGHGDHVFFVETPDPRVGGGRRVAFGGVVDGRAWKPGVSLIVLTSDGALQSLGISHRDQAVVAARMLKQAWPGLLGEVLRGE